MKIGDVDLFKLGWGWFMGFSRQGLKSFVRLMMNIYTDSGGENFTQFVDEYGFKDMRESFSHVSDMSLLTYYADTCRVEDTFFDCAGSLSQIPNYSSSNLLKNKQNENVCFIAETIQTDVVRFDAFPPIFVNPQNNTDQAPVCVLHFAHSSKYLIGEMLEGKKKKEKDAGFLSWKKIMKAIWGK